MTTDPDLSRSPDRARTVIAACAAAIVVLAALAVVGLVKLTRGSTSSGDSSYADQATTAMADGGQLAIDFSSFDYRTLDADLAATAKHATPTFAKTYLAQSKYVEGALKKAKAVSTATVRSTALESFSPAAGTATVLVALNDTTKNTKSPAGTVQYFRMQVQMQRDHGEWLASDVTPL
ncbi:MAG TPA: hypothetical protein VMH41_14235 [Mycobacteriales bacterium]|nr:hypothetical protein [Mycobacteriales bacterium]